LFKKFIKYLSYAFLAYIFLGFFILPFILKSQIIKNLQQKTNAKVSIESLYFNPLVFQVSIEDFSLKNLQNKELFSFETLRINADPSSLFLGALKLKELALINPKIYLIYNKDKSINLLQILKEDKTAGKQTAESNATISLPRIIVESVDMEGGELFYTDYTRKTPFTFLLENIGFTLEGLDTKTIEHSSAGIRFYSRLGDGGFVDFKSSIRSLKPFKIDGSLAFEASKLYTEWKYMRDVLKLEVADGKISFFTKYALNLDDLKSMKIEGLNLAVNRLRIKPKAEDRDILNLETMYLKNATLLPLKQDVDIEKIGLYGLKVKVKRYGDEQIDWLEYLKSNDSDANTTQKAPLKSKSMPWSVVLHTLALEKIAVKFDDEVIVPNVSTEINELDIYANNITLEGAEPFEYQIKMRMNDTTLCDINGSLVHKELQLSSQLACRALDIVHYRPYIDKAARENLQQYDIALKSALFDFATDISLNENNSSYAALLKDTNVSLHQFRLNKKSTDEELVVFRNFQVRGLRLDTAKKELHIPDVLLDSLGVKLARYKDSTLNIDAVVIPKKAKKPSQKNQKVSKPYRVTINQAAVRNAKLEFLDKALNKEHKQSLDKINVTLSKIDSKKRSWLRYKASLRVNKKGELSAEGKVRHTPLRQSGSVRAKGVSLAEMTPYLQEKSYLQVDDGVLSFRVNESYQPSKKYPDVRVHGEVGLNSLFISNTNDANASLFSLNELRVKPFTLELFPNRLYIDEVGIDSFYLSAKIDENKTINFAKLMRSDSNESISGSETKQSSEKQKGETFAVKVVKVDVKNGSAEFEDLSLPIKFKTNIHNLKGSLYAISSTPGDTTYVDIGGDVDKYGSTKLKGSVDSFNPKEYTDLDFNFKNLDLHAMSGYSASFAGYEIDSGKLYLDLGYEILHSQLKATNNIMIKKIKLGRELEGDDVNHLPLGFVIGLLEDSDGIIDIDMPIEGNVDEPDFKYGTLVWKTLGNLIAKAVTSPFKFLGSMMGLDGEELEFIAFEYGRSEITPPQREKLDKIAKMMDKRPKISLKISATYDEIKDLEALKLQKLVAMVMKKSGDENSKKGVNALNIDMLEELYDELRDDDKLDTLRERLRKEYKEDKAYERAYQNALISLCAEIQNVTSLELEGVADKRAEAIKNYLVQEKALEAQRVLQGELVTRKERDKKMLELELNIEVQSEDK
jgi:hypothetical protein